MHRTRIVDFLVLDEPAVETIVNTLGEVSCSVKTPKSYCLSFQREYNILLSFFTNKISLFVELSIKTG